MNTKWVRASVAHGEGAPRGNPSHRLYPLLSLLLATVFVFALPPAAAAQLQTPESVSVGEDQIHAFAQAVLSREDIRTVGTRYVGFPARDGQRAVTYRTRHCGSWRLPDGTLVQAMTFEDAEARRSQDRLLTRVEGERPDLEVYRGYFLGLGRTSPAGALRAVRLEIPPAALFAEIDGCGEPEHSELHGWALPLRHTALLYEPNVTRRVFFESTFSLETLAFVSQREVFEQRYHVDTRELERFRDGELVDARIIEESEDPRTGFVAAGQVLDERGEPAQNVSLRLHWYERIRLSSVSNTSVEKQMTLETDRYGGFEQRVRRTRMFDVDLYKAGYLPGRYRVLQEEVPKTMRLVPIPVGTVRGPDLMRGQVRGRLSIGDLAQVKGVGFSMKEFPGPPDAAIGWTLNRDEADLWFEITDPLVEDKHREYLEGRFSRSRLDDAGRRGWGFEVTLLGLRGTEFAVAPAVEEDGLWDMHQYREAPLTGYVTRLSGLAPERRDPGVVAPPETLPNRFYLRKNGRYGKLIGVEFEFRVTGKEQPGTPYIDWPRYLEWRVDRNQFAMQARPLGNRLLFVTEDEVLVPTWVNKR